MSNLKLSKESFYKLRDLIYDLSGIFFSENKRYFLEARIIPRLEVTGCESYDDYYNLLSRGIRRQKEIRSLVDLITTHETSFFRESPQFEVLKSKVFPKLIKKKEFGFKNLRIWSAACSSGEEPYTIAMFANEDPTLNKPPWNVEIIGTDISETILGKAKRGIYTPYSLRNTPGPFKKKYFKKTEEGYQIRNIRNGMVNFAQVNLINPIQMSSMHGFDVIFCRNTLIYFDAKSKAKVIQYLYDSLLTGGYLFLSMTESMFGVETQFKTVRANGCVIYQKQEGLT